MAWNKHASSRILGKNGCFGIKSRWSRVVTAWVVQLLSRSWHPLGLEKARTNKPERKYVLMKTADMMVDFVRTNKIAFRMADSRIPKVQQSRYERRRVREFLRLGDWAADAS